MFMCVCVCALALRIVVRLECITDCARAHIYKANDDERSLELNSMQSIFLGRVDNVEKRPSNLIEGTRILSKERI